MKDPTHDQPHDEPRDDLRRERRGSDERPGADHRAAEGVDHLQAAASELIAAARSFLDVVEEVVRDREAVAAVVDTLGSVAHAATQAATKVAAAGRPGGDEGEPPHVQHIRVS